jgi:hypothetical protein
MLFKVGDRVEWSTLWRNTLQWGRSDRGVVTGVSRNGTLVVVRKDGQSTSMTYSAAFWQLEKPKPPAPWFLPPL